MFSNIQTKFSELLIDALKSKFKTDLSCLKKKIGALIESTDDGFVQFPCSFLSKILRYKQHHEGTDSVFPNANEIAQELVLEICKEKDGKENFLEKIHASGGFIQFTISISFLAQVVPYFLNQFPIEKKH